ncbi:MAG TPA: hypothetical protein H9771_06265 [Candidatus Faecalibacterium faecipullorum]|uniref:DUF3784 domain-containing protein n=2 Tax=Faecalibacterium TaxID=216851 RepID=A0A9D1QAB1_9FIRM|nr:hypothetical protein [Candidatus Faecalibacterium intestinigallinarum]HJB59241.1 hypothetical protein [Candidatus Faecalibacterium faecipullorum]
MDKNLLSFLGWSAAGLFFEGLAVYIWFCKKPVSFSSRPLEVTDRKRYNHAVAKLYMVYGAVFILLGLPLLAAPIPGWAAWLMVAGIAGEAAACRAVYALVIRKKYKKHYGDWRD